MSRKIYENGEVKNISGTVADATLSETSKNPVQNKVVTEKLNQLNSNIANNYGISIFNKNSIVKDDYTQIIHACGNLYIAYFDFTIEGTLTNYTEVKLGTLSRLPKQSINIEFPSPNLSVLNLGIRTNGDVLLATNENNKTGIFAVRVIVPMLLNS